MKNIIVLTFCLSLPGAYVFADVKSDHKAGLPYTQIINNSMSDGNTMSSTLNKLFSIAPEESVAIVTAAITAKPNLTTEIVRTAIHLGIDSKRIISIALEAEPKQSTAIMTAAIEAGADPLMLAQAPTAAAVRPGPPRGPARLPPGNGSGQASPN